MREVGIVCWLNMCVREIKSVGVCVWGECVRGMWDVCGIVCVQYMCVWGVHVSVGFCVLG